MILQKRTSPIGLCSLFLVKGGKKMEKTYLISDAAKQVQVETHVLRYWEEELGLPIKRNKLGHRYYTEGDVEFFKEVKKMKDTGLQLKAIRLYMKDGQISPVEEETKIVPIHTAYEEQIQASEHVSPIETLEESREEKSLRLQYLLKQFIKEAVQDSNQELYNQMKDVVLKELVKLRE